MAIEHWALLAVVVLRTTQAHLFEGPFEVRRSLLRELRNPGVVELDARQGACLVHAGRGRGGGDGKGRGGANEESRSGQSEAHHRGRFRALSSGF